MTKQTRRSIKYIQSLGILEKELDEADHIDIKQYEGEKDLQQFIADMFSYSPFWLSFLYKIRKVFVRLLGMTQEEYIDDICLKPEDISMIPGENVLFFKVKEAKKDQFWIGIGEDKHLSALIGIVLEKTYKGTNQYHIITIVHYRDWSGPVYFNVIRPFHHLVVHAMAKHGVKKSV